MILVPLELHFEVAEVHGILEEWCLLQDGVME